MAQHVIAGLTPEQAMRAQRMEQKQLRKAIHAAQLDSAHATRAKVVGDSPVDQGHYKSGWEVVDGKEPRIENDAPHAGIIENGARPFFPPLAPLVEWAKRKGFEDPEGAGRAIQRAIGRRGLKPHYIMRNRLKFARAALKRGFEEFLARPPGGRGRR